MDAPPRPAPASTARRLLSRKMLAVFFLGFSSGLPLALTGGTLQAWMADAKVDIKTIGLFALVGLPYTWKFIWSPMMDRFVPPFLGRRRGWMLITQLALAAAIAAMALARPDVSPTTVAAIAFAVAFFSASQDIVIDAFRTDVLEKEEFGFGASLNTTGYRVAMLVSGALALILADHLSWPTVYLVMAAFMAVGALATFAAPEPAVRGAPPRSLRDAVVLPFREFFGRRGSLEVLAFILLYRLDVVLTTALLTPFLKDLGFTNSDIGYSLKTFGVVALIAGALIGGAAIMKLGVKRSLWVFGLAQGVSGVAFVVLAMLGHHFPAMLAAVALEQFFSGMGTAAYTGFMMSLCDKRYSATQYALITSLMRLGAIAGVAPTGYLQTAVGWPMYFVIATFAMAPGLVALTRFERWSYPRAEPPVSAVGGQDAPGAPVSAGAARP